MIHIGMSDFYRDVPLCLSGAHERDETALHSHARSTCELDLEIIVFHSGHSPGQRWDAAGFFVRAWPWAGPVNLLVRQITERFLAVFNGQWYNLD